MKIAVGMLFALLLATGVLWLNDAATRPADAHCQMPCGIYDDPARVQQLREDATTIAKAVTSIADLAGKTDPTSVNQLVRWVDTKEEHASAIIELVSTYFLCQRVKPVGPDSKDYQAYLGKLADHHAVMLAAMKTKQVPTAETVAALNKAIDGLAKYYPPPAEKPAPAPMGDMMPRH